MANGGEGGGGATRAIYAWGKTPHPRPLPAASRGAGSAPPECDSFSRTRSGSSMSRAPIHPEDAMTRKKPEDLRSHRWLGVNDMRSFGHKSRLRQIGYDAEDWAGKPVIGIINTWSEINP